MQNKSLNIHISMDDFITGLNGKDCLQGTNFNYINKQIDSLNSKKKNNSLSLKEENQLTDYYCEIKRTNDGARKPKTCWSFVNNGSCEHCNKNNMPHGIIIGNKWHPANEERLYLKNKSSSKH
jgi:hypothetical protein